MKCLVANAIDVVPLDSRLYQLADDEVVPPLGSTDQTGPVPAVFVVDLGAVRQREPEQLEVALARRDEIGRLDRRVLGVDVGPLVDELPRRPDVVLPGRVAELLVERGLLCRRQVLCTR